MLAIEVEYLMGNVFSSAHHSRQEVEWPPHPSRLFAALVAAYKECDMGDDERRALEWLEELPSPAICADPPTTNNSRDCMRDVHSIFVPINDTSDPIRENKKKNEITKFSPISIEIPLGRDRKPRWFPSFTPNNNRVWFIWRDVDQDKSQDKSYTGSLQRIAEQVGYLGHSMSPVRMRVCNTPPEPTLVPGEKGPIKLCVTAKGRLTYLEQVYKLREVNSTIKPRLGRIASYRLAKASQLHPPASCFAYNYIFRLAGRPGLSLDMSDVATTTLRKAIMELYPDPVPDIISGHEVSGSPLQKPHLAITPLADVGHRNADGHIMGFGFWLPQDASSDVLATFELALSSLQSLKLGKHGVCTLEHINTDMMSRAPVGLRPETYSKFSDTWASVCPVIFGKYPKKSQIGPGKNGGKVFAELCDMIGLPAPEEVRMGPVSVFRGAPKASDFIYPENYRNNLKSHVVLRFDRPVKGPVLLGAGRYRGFGLCRPF